LSSARIASMISSETPLPMNTSSAVASITPRFCACSTTASRAGKIPFWCE
jgi:hypothetical protein